jgi:hypothetical protein
MQSLGHLPHCTLLIKPSFPPIRTSQPPTQDASFVGMRELRHGRRGPDLVRMPDWVSLWDMTLKRREADGVGSNRFIYVMSSCATCLGTPQYANSEAPSATETKEDHDLLNTLFAGSFQRLVRLGGRGGSVARHYVSFDYDGGRSHDGRLSGDRTFDPHMILDNRHGPPVFIVLFDSHIIFQHPHLAGNDHHRFDRRSRVVGGWRSAGHRGGVCGCCVGIREVMRNGTWRGLPEPPRLAVGFKGGFIRQIRRQDANDLASYSAIPVAFERERGAREVLGERTVEVEEERGRRVLQSAKQAAWVAVRVGSRDGCCSLLTTVPCASAKEAQHEPEIRSPGWRQAPRGLSQG